MLAKLCPLLFFTIAHIAADDSIRVQAVPRTPESSTIVLKIALPQGGEVLNPPVFIQFRIDGFALGAASSFERASEVAVSKMGQTVHVIIDDHPYFPINEPAIDPFDESGYYYDTSYKFKIPYRLGSGPHTIRMFPARSFGESLKGDNTFASLQFYVGEQKGTQIDLSVPYLTYNEPSSLMPLQAEKPILLDFYLSNAVLSPDGYKVRLLIDGQEIQSITTWQPYYIYGLSKGRHTIRLELLNSKNRLVSGPFSTVQETITVH